MAHLDAVGVGGEDLQRDEVVDERGVVLVRQVDDARDDAVHVFLLHLGDEAEVNQRELALALVVRPHQVARVGVAVEEPHLEQLGEEDLLPHLEQVPHLVGRALRQLDAVDPLRHEHAAARVLRVHRRDPDVAHALRVEELAHLVHVRPLVLEVELGVEPHRPGGGGG